LLLDEVGDVLLFRGGDPARPGAGTWWFTPGGGIDDGESAEEAARRELREETGLIVGELGRVVLRRHVEHQFKGMRITQDEDFFLVRCQSFEPDAAGWTEIERQVVEEHRWWSRERLRKTDTIVYPADLADVLDQLDRS
jgi:8-oxo-dGTP pyrophosphatase MutT (NUDIX family)